MTANFTAYTKTYPDTPERIHNVHEVKIDNGFLWFYSVSMRVLAAYSLHEVTSFHQMEDDFKRINKTTIDWK